MQILRPIVLTTIKRTTFLVGLDMDTFRLTIILESKNIKMILGRNFGQTAKFLEPDCKYKGNRSKIKKFDVSQLNLMLIHDFIEQIQTDHRCLK